MTAAEIVRVFGAKRAGPGRWIARCPHHDDRKPSLYLAERKDRMLIKCFQCDTQDILHEVGLRFRDLFFYRRDLPSEQLRELYRQRRVEENQKKQQRVEDLKNVIEAVDFGASPVRRKTEFERLIEAAYR